MKLFGLLGGDGMILFGLLDADGMKSFGLLGGEGIVLIGLLGRDGIMFGVAGEVGKPFLLSSFSCVCNIGLCCSPLARSRLLGADCMACEGAITLRVWSDLNSRLMFEFLAGGITSLSIDCNLPVKNKSPVIVTINSYKNRINQDEGRNK